jgi:hypothetical protein
VTHSTHSAAITDACMLEKTCNFCLSFIQNAYFEGKKGDIGWRIVTASRTQDGVCVHSLCQTVIPALKDVEQISTSSYVLTATVFDSREQFWPWYWWHRLFMIRNIYSG